MKETIKAYSKSQLRQTSIRFSEYTFMKEEGTFRAVMDYKGWGNGCLTGYFTFDDGRRIFASAFQDRNYLGLTDIPMGAAVELTFKKAKTNNNIYLRRVTLPDEQPAA